MNFYLGEGGRGSGSTRSGRARDGARPAARVRLTGVREGALARVARGAGRAIGRIRTIGRVLRRPL